MSKGDVTKYASTFIIEKNPSQRGYIETIFLYKKLFGCINHHQLLNEYVLHNFFAFYQTLLIVKSN